MKPWSELLTQMMLGTQNANMPAGEFAGLAPEQALLKQLGLAGAYRRAGYVARAAKSLPEANPAPPERLPACSLNAVDWLRRVEGYSYTQALALDWFLFMHGRGKRVPHSALPYLLELSNRHATWGPYIVPVLGERGRWMVERSDAYPHLRLPELWMEGELPPLNKAEFDPNNKMLIDLRNQMMEGLAHE
jgi:hypothetical protein